MLKQLICLKPSCFAAWTLFHPLLPTCMNMYGHFLTLTACANKLIHYPELIFQILSRMNLFKGLYEPGVPYFVHISFASAKRLTGRLHVKSLLISQCIRVIKLVFFSAMQHSKDCFVFCFFFQQQPATTSYSDTLG